MSRPEEPLALPLNSLGRDFEGSGSFCGANTQPIKQKRKHGDYSQTLLAIARSVVARKVWVNDQKRYTKSGEKLIPVTNNE